MGLTKITLLQLGERLRAGKTPEEIGAEFGMTPRAVRKRAAGLDLEISKAATLHQADIILAQGIDANEQMLKINRSINSMKDLLEVRLQDQEGQIDRGVAELLIKVLAEMRKQLELLEKAASTWLEAKRLVTVQQAMLAEIGAESAECRARIIRRLGGLQSAGLLFAGDVWT